MLMRKSPVSILWFTLLCPLFITAAVADGVLQVKGKVISFDKKQVVVEVGKTQLFTIRRSALKKEESDQITRSEVQVALNVPMEGIKSVSDIPPPAKKK